MARVIGKLTALRINKANKPGMYSDGGGLYLQVNPSGTKSWIYRFMLNGRSREMGLGPLHTVTLADARSKAMQCRQLRLEGRDPIEVRKASKAAARLAASKAIRFRQCAEALIEAKKPGWRNTKHGEQWSATLKAYTYPVFGDVPVQNVDVGLVTRALEQIWTAKPETASRVRGRIEAVLDWAAARGYRSGDNPARWRGHLENLLPAPMKVRRVQHHPALPYADMFEFMHALDEQKGMAADALRYLIFTATRTSETLGARWEEFDLRNGLWVVPAERIKTGREHRIPLSAAALDIVKRLAAGRLGDYVFLGGKSDKPLSNMALLALLRRMGRNGLTVHGFRSTFRDWAAERSAFPREVAEMALAHAIDSKVEAAYRRGDLLEKRRNLMEDWAKFCATPPAAGNVVSIVGAQTA